MSDKDFGKEVVSGTVGRSMGTAYGILGAKYGTLLGPVGTILGGAAGYTLGYVIGKNGSAEIYEDATRK